MPREPQPEKFRCTGALEGSLRRQGYRYVAGTDEAGRGSLFGPVVAAAVILDPGRPVRGINDSKQVAAPVRESLAESIKRAAVAWAVGLASAGEIDAINIYQASRLAMRRAVEGLSPKCDYLLVDALKVDWPVPQQALIKGDARVRAIAAASILAKVDRDARLCEFDRHYPGYNLASNKGYPTPDHLEALQRLGPTPLHRRSYAPVQLSMQLMLCL
ncbi:MAG: ribonuclease HII [Bryobacterales bacterium]|nr:ribonuclease HII [Bryobacterales bacterium]